MRNVAWYKLLVILVAPSIVVLGCRGKSEGEASDFQEKEAWVTEEILQQLVDLQKTVSELQKNIADLNAEVAKLSSDKRRSSPLSQVDIGDGVVLGDTKAPFAIVEFMDYQCPFCVRHASQVLPQIKKELIDTGKVKYIIRDFPLSSHNQAKGAAIAVNCAGEQEKYWEMHEQFVENSRKLNGDYYIQAANDLALDVNEFKRCLAKPEHEDRINGNLAYGVKVGVTGTPRFFVGRVKGASIDDVEIISGAQPFAAFSRAVKKLSNMK